MLDLRLRQKALLEALKKQTAEASQIHRSKGFHDEDEFDTILTSDEIAVVDKMIYNKSLSEQENALWSSICEKLWGNKHFREFARVGPQIF